MNNKQNGLPLLDYLYLVRIPFLSGILLCLFPLTAEFVPFCSQLFQNLFVMSSREQLITVMVFVSLTSITIVSLIKTAIVLKVHN